ncbi:MAG: lactonase family protein [Janthinobacterium lividum]
MNMTKWTRRQFSQALGLAAAGTLLPRSGFSMDTSVGTGTGKSGGLAFVGSDAPAGEDGAIHVFRVSDANWQHLQTVPAAAPGRILLHPTLPVLYALHNVGEWKHLPRGAVSAYGINSQSGQLTHLGSQPLSLSATFPRHATLTAGGSHLFVSSGAGAMYNVLPVSPDGSLLAVAGIRKEFGVQDESGARTAFPGAVAFMPDGTLLSVDAGQGAVNCFQLRGNDLTVQQRTPIQAGHGADKLAVAPCGLRAYALHPSGKLITTLSLRERDPKRSQGMSSIKPEQTELMAQAVAKDLILAPGGSYLLAESEALTDVLKIAPGTGLFVHHAQLRGAGEKLTFAAGMGLLGLDVSTGAVRQTAFDAVHGTAAPSEIVAHVQNPVSLVFRPEGDLKPGMRAL